jgi:hypothetical protein
MLWDNEEGDGFGAVDGFARIALREAERTSEALSTLEARLYSARLEDDQVPETDSVKMPADEFRRFETMGYSAHTDNVEEHEIRDWQRAFTYLRVEGKCCLPKSNQESEELYGEGVQFVHAPLVAQAAATVPMDDEMSASLSVVGRHIEPTLAETRTADQEEHEEVFASHGILEELLEVDYSPCEEAGTGVNADGVEEIVCGDPISPRAARRSEVVSILADAVWPEIVESLRPLVRKIVSESRAANLKYPTDPQMEDTSVTVMSARIDSDGW